MYQGSVFKAAKIIQKSQRIPNVAFTFESTLGPGVRKVRFRALDPLDPWRVGPNAQDYVVSPKIGSVWTGPKSVFSADLVSS